MLFLINLKILLFFKKDFEIYLRTSKGSLLAIDEYPTLVLFIEIVFYFEFVGAIKIRFSFDSHEDHLSSPSNAVQLLPDHVTDYSEHSLCL